MSILADILTSIYCHMAEDGVSSNYTGGAVTAGHQFGPKSASSVEPELKKDGCDKSQ